MPKINITKHSGFTLIELLVVISIIGLLSSMAVFALNVARVKARDARRKVDLVQIRKALLLYVDNHGGALPTSGFGSSNGGQSFRPFIFSVIPHLPAPLAELAGDAESRVQWQEV